MEVSRVTLNAIRMKSEMRLFWDDPERARAVPLGVELDQVQGGDITYRSPSTFVPLPLRMVR